MLFLRKTGETIWKFPLSTNPPISEQFFHDPPLCPNFKNEIPPIFLWGERGAGEETMNDLSNKVIISLQQQHFLLMILLFFSVVNDVNLSEFYLNNDLKNI